MNIDEEDCFLHNRKLLSPGFRRPVLAVALSAALLLGGCAGMRTTADGRAGKVVDAALNLKGTPYVWGGNTPDEGFDCSGFVRYVYGKHGVRLPRTARQMALALPEIDWDERQPGDLLFFNTTGDEYSHVGIYMGKNTFVHASSRFEGGQVTVSDANRPYWMQHLTGVRRPLSWN
jgi:cell wall-associated NlpC family hydrolase